MVGQDDFPKFVTDVLCGVFQAIVDATIKQMEAYAELVKNVTPSFEQKSTTSPD